MAYNNQFPDMNYYNPQWVIPSEDWNNQQAIFDQQDQDLYSVPPLQYDTGMSSGDTDVSFDSQQMYPYFDQRMNSRPLQTTTVEPASRFFSPSQSSTRTAMNTHELNHSTYYTSSGQGIIPNEGYPVQYTYEVPPLEGIPSPGASTQPYPGDSVSILKDDSGRWLCPHCAKTFDRRSRAVTCWNTHFQIRHFVCGGSCGYVGCPSSFGSQEGLGAHIDGRKKIQCNSCGQWNSKKNISRHLRNCKALA